MNIKFSLLATALGSDASLIGKDISFDSISINTRTLVDGDVFVAIKGEKFDAHEFVRLAEKKGAKGLVVDRKVTSELPQLCVKDTREALGKIALLWRENFSLPMIAITGSCGKTTVKEMTAAILQNTFNNKDAVLATQGNLNNDIGVPLTLMRLNAKHKAAVIELGANHQGEIRQLVKMVKPDVALITNAGYAHIEGFGSLEGVAKAKAEIYSGLVNKNEHQSGNISSTMPGKISATKPRKRSIAIINADDAFAAQWIQCNQQAVQDGYLKILSFGLNNTADVSANYQKKADGIELILNTPAGEQTLLLKRFGQHNIYNALAAASAALAIGCSLTDVKNGLESFTEVCGRFESKNGKNGAMLFDDTYNANPGSVIAGIDALKQISEQQSANNAIVLILGDMGELGEASEQLHYQLGRDIADMEVSQLLTVGRKTQETHTAYCEQVKQLKKDNMLAKHFQNKEDLIENLNDKFKKNELILIKGSRSMAMESVVSAMENTH